MYSDKLLNLISKRKNCYIDNNLSFVVNINSKLNKIRIQSRVPICLIRLDIDSSPLQLCICGDSLDQMLFDDLSNFKYVSKWNSSGDYFLELDIKSDTFISQLEFTTDVNNQNCDWIFGAVVSTYGPGVVKIADYDFWDGENWLDAKAKSDPSVFNFIYDCAHRKNYGRAFWYYKNFKKTFSEKKMEQLEFYIRDVLGDSTISQHGYRRSLNGSNRKVLALGIKNVMDSMQSIGLNTFIASGTLLGAVRHGSFLSHDDDVDLGLILVANCIDDFALKINDASSILAKNGLLLRNKIKDQGEPIRWKLKSISGVTIDLFPAWVCSGKVYAYPYSFGEISDNSLYPLKSLSIEGVEVSAPSSPEDFLACNYGPEWRIPNPAFHFDWDFANERFKNIKNKITMEH